MELCVVTQIESSFEIYLKTIGNKKVEERNKEEI